MWFYETLGGAVFARVTWYTLCVIGKSSQIIVSSSRTFCCCNENYIFLYKFRGKDRGIKMLYDTSAADLISEF